MYKPPYTEAQAHGRAHRQDSNTSPSFMNIPSGEHKHSRQRHTRAAGIHMHANTHAQTHTCPPTESLYKAVDDPWFLPASPT